MKTLILMDPIGDVDPFHDTSVSIAYELSSRKHSVHICDPRGLSFESGKLWTKSRQITFVTPSQWKLSGSKVSRAVEFNPILMRKDPPVNLGYQSLCFQLSTLKNIIVTNRPNSLLTLNEKLFSLKHPKYSPRTLVSQELEQMRLFAKSCKKGVVLKPIDGFAGRGIFTSHSKDLNFNVICETLTHRFTAPIVLQEYLSAIRTKGDKRVIVIDGKPIGAISRIPSSIDHRGNMAAGARATKASISRFEREVIQTYAPDLQAADILLAGFDFIGDLLTEINITSPTGFQEIKKLCKIDCAKHFVDALENRVLSHSK